MPSFETGVASYVEAEATVKVFFPVDAKGNADICCRQCYYFRTSSQSCALNGEICQYPNKYVGMCCPLKPTEERNENE